MSIYFLFLFIPLKTHGCIEDGPAPMVSPIKYQEVKIKHSLIRGASQCSNTESSLGVEVAVGGCW